MATGGGPQSTIKVVVRVEDENDNAPLVRYPSFTDRASIDVPVSASVGTLLARIQATDPDEGLNGALTYTLVNGNEDGLFAIDRETGTLTTARRLTQVCQSQHNVDDTVGACPLYSPDNCLEYYAFNGYRCLSHLAPVGE